MTTYAIRGGAEGARRLDLLAQVMAPTTDALLNTAGVAAGMTCLDVGCGAGHVSRTLAALVGPKGRVVGLDFDAVKLATATQECQRAGLENLEFRCADVTKWSEPMTYDIVYGRFIVSHLGERPEFIARLRDGLRNEGTLILEDIDFSGAFCYPPSAAFDRYCELYTEVIRHRGGDANLGARLYQLCLDAGFQGVNLRVVQPVHAGRVPEKELTLSTMVNIEDAVIAEALATREELEGITASLTEYTEDPRSIVGCPRIFEVWGRKSA